jgi:hypothetical protein
VPLHLVRNDKRIKRVSGFATLRIPVFLNYHTLEISTRLQKTMTTWLLERTGQYF